ncbi:hypothetical protein Dsin_025440 [Dipteronia sinensis]|uniref:Uncharacterized protein n=1 Tax=Dipteronia sinensis TaxID=43782 RepID=A0AAE0DWT2_9ROSI|nr:hypothetical protein Dsin_025439 [Dipteronia sinensis]KAK3194130.1 hypothetical protein Dsin_025440 [Dipteronia sinensis]
MARSVSNAKLFSAFVVDGISNAIYRRGYAAAAAASQGVVSRGSGMVKKSGEEMVGSTEKVAWVPDPVTGYYRPENLANELDVADLRAMLLKNNN